jgi:hypothetical protein
MTNVSGTPTERFKFTDGGAFNASSNITLNGSQVLAASNYNSYAPTLTGTGASGTWGINVTGSSASCTGNAVTATTASNANLLNSISAVNLYNNMGNPHGTYTSFDATTPSYGFGYRYIQGNANGPATGQGQYYSWYIGLGSEYPATGAGSYGAMFAVGRTPGTAYLSVRFNESNSFGAWQKIYAGYADTAGSATSATSATTATTANATNTANNFQMNSLGVGTAGSGTAGQIRATDSVVAFYSSDIKFKENIQDIPNASATASAIGGKLFDWKDDYIEAQGGEDGYFVQKADFGVVAQDVQKHFPRAVRTKQDGSLAVDYEKLSALALAAVAEHEARIKKLEALVAKLIEGQL